MQISLIVALSANNVIGVNGNLPWRLSDDLRHFKQVTMGKPVVMGRATFESIGRPLPGRQNIVLSRQTDFSAPGCDVVASRAAVVELLSGSSEVFVIGGAEIYAAFMPLATRLYLTRVHAQVAGDTRFPGYDREAWQLAGSRDFAAGEGNEFAFTIETLVRRHP